MQSLEIGFGITTKDIPKKIDKCEKSLQNYLDDILDASFDGIIISDFAANIIKLNKAYEKLSAIPKKELVGYNIKDLVKNRTLTGAVVLEVIKTHIPTTTIHFYPRTGKHAMVTASPVFDKNRKLVYVMANFRDITQLSKISKKLGYPNILEFGKEALYLKSDLGDLPDYGILVRNKKMKECLQQAVRVAKFDINVLILGESGVGKTKLAEIIHKASSRSNKPFISINCSSIPENLLESELFGYEKGAFTGASVQGKAGQFELASKGTLVLDEIAELGLPLQAKLLKVIDEKQILKIGGTNPLDVDVRIIAVTNRDLKSMVDNHEFRKDLYFRLNVMPIVVPPLRERVDEIPLLIKYFFNKFNSKYGMHKHPGQDLLRTLSQYEYPGNVRELKNMVERLIIMSSEDLISLDNLEAFSVKPEIRFINGAFKGNYTLHQFLEDCEKRIILKVLKEEKTLRSAANQLGISSPTLWRKLKKHELAVKKMIEHIDISN
ncbi:MAG: sigma 54-interacting transcriptional regulator [Deltaproteobacteria bacterium]|nr:sigma 54-interacting transcriptional regulator [Deltaproteobacteria bacterium]